MRVLVSRVRSSVVTTLLRVLLTALLSTHEPSSRRERDLSKKRGGFEKSNMVCNGGRTYIDLTPLTLARRKIRV